MKKTMAFLAMLIIGSMSPLSGAHGQTGGPYLDIDISWVPAGGGNANPAGVYAAIFFLPDHMVVAAQGSSVEAGDLIRGCTDRIMADRLKAGRDPKGPVTNEELAIIVHCWRPATVTNLEHVNDAHAVFLPYTPGSRKCTEMVLSHGQYRTCARLLQKEGDNFRLEYEVDENNKSGLFINRTRFDLTLRRRTSNPDSPIAECQVHAIAGFNSDPERPENLRPLDHVTSEHCHPRD